MSAAIDFIQYGERMVGEASPDYDDTLNRALKTVVSVSGADEDAFVGFALRPVVAPSVGQFYRATDTDVGASWQTLTAAMVSDLTSAATGITKVGTINTGAWQGTSIATTYTDAKVKTVTGTANRLTVGGTATDPTFDISSAYVGQATITTLGTVTTGVWTGTSIGTTYTDAKVVSLSGVTDRTTISGTAGVPIIDIAATYVGQGSITTVGTIASGTWQGTSIATTYTDAKIKTVTGTVGTITISGTSTDPIFTISAAYIGQNTITTLGTVTTGVWNGTAVATAFTIAQVIDLTGTTNRITIGGTATHPTVDVSASYIGQATITTLGTIATGVWNGTSITTSFTDAKVKTVTGTASRVTIGGTATDPTFDISAAYVGQATITTVGTVTTGTWAATAITVDKGGTNLTSFTAGDMIYASGATTLTKLAIGTAAQILVTNGAATAPAWHTLVTADITDLTSATTGITKLGTVTTGVWNAGVIPALYGGTGVNNGSNTITLGGALTTSGAFATTLTVTGATNVTLPTTGTLINSAVTTLASLTSVGGAFAISGAFTGATTGAFSSTLSTSQLTITDTASRIIPGATSFSHRNNANNADNLLISDAGAVTIRAGVTATTASFSGALTYGGVTLSNAVSGTGNMVLSASPTLTGTVTVTGATITGLTAASVATGTFPGVYTVTGALTLSAALTYGGITLSNAVTGTGNMVLSASPTFTGTVTAAIATFSGAVTVGGLLSANANLTVQKLGTAAVLTVDGSSGGTSASYVEFQSGEAPQWRVGHRAAGTAAFAIFDMTNSSIGIAITPGVNPAVAFNGAVTGITNLTVGGSIGGVTSLNMSSTLTNTSGAIVLSSAAGSSALTLDCHTGSGAITTYKLDGVTKWLAGYNIVNVGRWEVYDSANAVLGFSVTPGANPAVAFNGPVSGATTFAATTSIASPIFGTVTNVDASFVRNSVEYFKLSSTALAVTAAATFANGITVTGGAVVGSIATDDPSGGVGVWLLGKYLAAVVTLDTAHYVEVKIDGTLRKLAIVT